MRNNRFGTEGGAAAPQAGPFPPDASESGPLCRCGHRNPTGQQLCELPRCRRVLPGNSISRRTELYAANHSPEVVAIEDAAQALCEQSLIDAGGRDQLIARVVAGHQNRAVLQETIAKLALALRRHGMFDKRGRLRTAWLQRLESMIGTAAAIDKTLGLERRAKHLPRSIAEALRTAPEVGR